MKRIMYVMANIVKLQTKVQALALDNELTFFPLSQQDEEEEEPHQNIAEGCILEVLNLPHRLKPFPLLTSPTDINSTSQR